MRQMIEAAFDVRVQHIFGFGADFIENGSDGIVLAASRSESITVGFKLRFPFWFQGLFGECLTGPVVHHRNTKRTLLRPAGLGNPDPTNRLGLPLPLVRGVNRLCQGGSCWWCER